MSLSIVPTTIREATAYVAEHHRHHEPPLGGLFALACSDGEKVCGVAIVGRPVARMLQDDFTAEVTRLCTDGTHNACSLLYSAAWRAARALGYRRLVTYTLPEEGGFTARVGMASHRRSRRRVLVPEGSAARGHAPDADETTMGSGRGASRER